MAQPLIPSALEFLDAASLDLIRAKHPGMLPDDTRAMLMIEVDGAAGEINGATESILQACQTPGLIQAAAVADTQSLWKARKALSPLLRDIARARSTRTSSCRSRACPNCCTACTN